ncbi:putative uncharacterized protein DDB_G0271982 [Mytilus californianus]|uniref:putative uncharacterized protein DDB_G0271982 n=1 Tax=Mytilus californianus TaxID=6549 RepID=UPI0022468AB8|nr:putative uncharacterized protein DDB_G0271982 [Mytilus californianus]
MASCTPARKKQARFSVADDIKLLREVTLDNPFRNKGKWIEIGEKLSTTTFLIDGRRARERTNLLITQFKKDNRENLKKSGINEEYSERESLLEEVIGLMEEEERKKDADKEKTASLEKASLDIRKRALETLTPTKDCDAEEAIRPKKSKSSNNILSYLQEKKEVEMEIRKEEMEMKKQQLQFEREKFELEKNERRQRMDIERQEKMMIFEMFRKRTRTELADIFVNRKNKFF